jgi:hypothetical protein
MTGAAMPPARPVPAGWKGLLADARQPCRGVTMLCLDAAARPRSRGVRWPGWRPSDVASLADRLAQALRADDMVSELDDGVFACLLAGSPNRERLCLLSWRLLAALPARSAFGPMGRVARPAIGIAIGPADGRSYITLFSNALAALAQARALGAGVGFFDKVMDIGLAPP